MKKIPEKYELDDVDIREAIDYWLNNEHGDGESHDFTITFYSELKKVKAKSGSKTAFNGEEDVLVISAIAEKE